MESDERTERTKSIESVESSEKTEVKTPKSPKLPKLSKNAKSGKAIEYDLMTYDEICRYVTPEVKKLVELYEVTCDAVLSAQEAGFSVEDGYELLGQAKIMAYRRLRTRDIYEKRGLTSEDIIIRIDDFYRRSIQAVPHMSRNPDTKEMEPDGTWVYDSKDAFNALKLLGSVFNIGALNDVEAERAESVEDFIRRMREAESDE